MVRPTTGSAMRGGYGFEQDAMRAATEYGRCAHLSATWLHVHNPEVSLRDHGWKLHISARPSQLERLAEIVVPELLAAGCHFRMIRSAAALQAVSGEAGGKAWTIYPSPAQIRELGTLLAELLRGEAAPRVPGDNRVAEDAPVYYRYGSFGRRGVPWHSRSVQQQPPWAVDPFLETADAPKYGLVEILSGNVYYAQDVRTGERVVVKQARARVAESDDGHDARVRLRNEHYVLERLSEISGVPRYLDHFRHGVDEYLVTSFDGRFTLAQDVARNGRYRVAAARPAEQTRRSLDRLATRLARILGDIHARGFIVADLSPKNIVIRQHTGEPTIIDFGLCNHGEVRPAGGTPGYATHAQLSGAPTTIADDLYALGMTLLFAATGADPAAPGPDPDTPRRRARQAIRRIYGPEPPPLIRCIAGLLDPDPDRPRAALSALGSGHPERFRTIAIPVAGIYRGPADLVDQLRAAIIERTNALLDQPGGWPEPGALQGAAGVGLELLHHLDRPEAAEAVRRLAHAAADTARRTRTPPGLFVGSTGIDVLLRRVRDEGIDAPSPTNPVLAEWDRRPGGDDLVEGGAGIGFGHCLLAEAVSTPPEDRPRHLAAARACASRFLDRTEDRKPCPPDHLPPAAGIDASIGMAHGQAGIIAFLTQLVRLGALPADEPAVNIRLAELYRHTRALIDRSSDRTAARLCVSWCRGLAGIGTTLLRVAALRGDAEAMDLALAAGTTCATWLPELNDPSACCGIAGVGDFLLRLSDATRDAHFTEAAWSAATQLLAHDLTDGTHVNPADPADQRRAVSWAYGHSGILGFLRRLHTGDAPATLGPF
ncbi:hypothetical protein NDR87_10880 [Nocardia sp. CDC159]|uniref:non-specific serine/threonine protein kinase n=1 Tax=Nocardia pulmonis TaxID=2951408 RepID=A0A9X2E5E0_9NOCA|nr:MULTISPECIES: lanthionine synthetase LanC family protein [Nocardia]MCM6773975.1 hypothetical protein [Nocardia pulmonis]MCM6786862.1 hypothetical protein [Nocardia sp. CDC159]